MKEIEVSEGVAQSDHICHECQGIIKTGEKFGRITSGSGSKYIRAGVKHYHLPECPKFLEIRLRKGLDADTI